MHGPPLALALSLCSAAHSELGTRKKGRRHGDDDFPGPLSRLAKSQGPASGILALVRFRRGPIHRRVSRVVYFRLSNCPIDNSRLVVDFLRLNLLFFDT